MSGRADLGRAFTLVARAVHVVGASLAILELAQTAAVADLRAVAHRRVIRAVERNVRADAFGGGEVARLARRIACGVATDAVSTEVALALHAVGAHGARALLRALRPTTIDVFFVAVFHAVAARDAILLKTARVCPGVAVAVDDTIDAHAHVVTVIAVVAACTNRIVCRHRHAVVTALVRARIVIAWRRIVVVLSGDDVPVAVANFSLAIAVCRVVDDQSLRAEHLTAHARAHHAEPVDAVCIVGTIA